ncbi:MAG: cyclic nucleotide-binding domain-containing protein, partial [Methylocystis sp.]|nr:cyclic nucleotide-binding domain-containing protein [Methylocystis sp.]
MALDDDVENLRRIPLFQDFELEALRLLVSSAETRLLRAGDALFRRDEPADGGFILTSGSIALGTEDDGRPAEKIVRPFTLLGERALVAPTRRPVTAMAREPAAVLKITRQLFHRVLVDYPRTAARARA